MSESEEEEAEARVSSPRAAVVGSRRSSGWGEQEGGRGGGEARLGSPRGLTPRSGETARERRGADAAEGALTVAPAFFRVCVCCYSPNSCSTNGVPTR